MLLKEAVFHRVGTEMAYGVNKNQFLIRVKTAKGNCSKITLRYMDKYQYFQRHDRSIRKKVMEVVAQDYRYDYFECIADFDALSITYYFEIESCGEKHYFGNGRFYEKRPVSSLDMFMFSTIAEEDLFKIPDWTENSIIYQIFPERFYRGDSYKEEGKFEKWDSKVKWDSFLGGNIRGIIDKLDYIEELGVNTLYLTPLFHAGSNHKYDTFDYFKIDPQFGDESTLKELVEKAHKRGIKVILDAVFNHCGTDFFAFKDLMEKQENSKYREWFDVESFPVKMEFPPNYKTFGYFAHMPKLIMGNRDTAEYFYEVCCYWIKQCNIDGWRIDVADEISHIFWKELRKRVKAIKNDAIIIGEVWYDSNSWLNGDEFDSVMNYDFYLSVQKFLGSRTITAADFAAEMGEVRGKYKIEPYNILWSLIDSHDTARFLHSAGNSKNMLKLALVLQMTMAGNPVIYYGDEVGMNGGADPDNRRGMVWEKEKQDMELFEFYKKVIKIRKENSLLRTGETKSIYAEKGVYCFERYNKNQKIVIIINREKSSFEMELKGSYRELITEKRATGKIVVSGESAAIFQKIR